MAFCGFSLWCRRWCANSMLERLWVVLVVVGYLGAGGLLFQLIEPPPPPPKHSVSKYTEACLNQLWIITGNFILIFSLISLIFKWKCEYWWICEYLIVLGGFSIPALILSHYYNIRNWIQCWSLGEIRVIIARTRVSYCTGPLYYYTKDVSEPSIYIFWMLNLNQSETQLSDIPSSGQIETSDRYFLAHFLSSPG